METIGYTPPPEEMNGNESNQAPTEQKWAVGLEPFLKNHSSHIPRGDLQYYNGKLQQIRRNYELFPQKSEAGEVWYELNRIAFSNSLGVSAALALAQENNPETENWRRHEDVLRQGLETAFQEEAIRVIDRGRPRRPSFQNREGETFDSYQTSASLYDRIPADVQAEAADLYALGRMIVCEAGIEPPQPIIRHG